MFFAKGEIIMNNIYKVIWSKAKNCYVVASEIARSHTKSASGSEKIGGGTRRKLLASLMALSLLCGGLGVAEASVHVDEVTGGANEVYTTTEVNTALDKKADKDSVYTKADTYSKTEVNTELDKKAAKDSVYTKADTYSKTEVNTELDKKAAKDSVYTKADTYSRTEVNTALNDKADKADVYSKTDAENTFATKTELTAKADATALAGKANTDLSNLTEAGKTAIKTTMTDELAKKADNDTVTALDGRVGVVEGKVATLETTVSDPSNGLVKKVTDLKTKTTQISFDPAKGTIVNGVDFMAQEVDAHGKGLTGVSTLHTTGAATIGGALTAAGVDAGTGAITGGSLSVTGEVKGNRVDAGAGEIKTTGVVNAGTLSTAGNATVGGELNATGKVSGKGLDAGTGAITGGSVDVGAGEIKTTGAVNAGTLSTAGNATVGGDLKVTGTITTNKMIFGEAPDNYTEIDKGKVTSKNSGINGAGESITSSSTFDAEKNEVGIVNNGTGDHSYHKQTSDGIIDNVYDLHNSNNRTQTKTETTDIITDENGNTSTTSQTASKNETSLKDKDGKNTNTTIDTAKGYDKTIEGENGKTSTKQEAGSISSTVYDKDGNVKASSEMKEDGSISNNATGDMKNTVGGNQTNKIDGNQENTIGGNQTTNVTGDISNTAKNITNVANEKLTDQVGTNTRVTTSTSITDTVGTANRKIEDGKITDTAGDSTVTTENGKGTTFAKTGSTEFSTEAGAPTDTNIAGNLITTGRVDANELGVSDKDGANTADLSVKAGEGVKASAGNGTTTGSLDVTAEEVSSSVTDASGKGSTFKQRIDAIMMESKNVSINAEETLTNEAKDIVTNASNSITEKVGETNVTTKTTTSSKSEIQNADTITSVQQTENMVQSYVGKKDGSATNVTTNFANASANAVTEDGQTSTVLNNKDGLLIRNTANGNSFTTEDGTNTGPALEWTNIKGNEISTGKVEANYVKMDYADVMKDLGVHGNATVDKDMTVKGNTTLGEAGKDTTLIVNSKATFNEIATFENGAEVKNGLTVSSGGLNVTGESMFNDKVTMNNGLDVTGGVASDSFTVKGTDIKIDSSGINAGGTVISNVADGSISEGSKDAVNGGQLYGVKRDLEHQVDKVGANAAAMANLRPMEFDPSSKWNIAAAIGNYGSETAAALGAFYRPNDNVMVNLSTAFGTGENMVGGGVSVRLGKGGNKLSRAETNALKAQVDDLTARMDALLSVLNPNMSKDFPDVPENHWAYEAVSRLAGNDIVQGYPDGEFHGERTMTRYEMAEIIYNALSRGAEAERELVEEFKPELQAMAASEKATAEKAEG